MSEGRATALAMAIAPPVVVVAVAVPHSSLTPVPVNSGVAGWMTSAPWLWSGVSANLPVL